MYEINFHQQLLARVFLMKRGQFEHEKVFQIIGIVLATEQSIKSFPFIFLGFCLNCKSTFAIKKFEINDFWNDFRRTPHDGCSC